MSAETIPAAASTPPQNVTAIDHRLEPAPFYVTDSTPVVMNAWLKAIEDENLVDQPTLVSQTGFAQWSGGFVIPSKTYAIDKRRFLLSYCWSAFRQLFERAGASSAPRGPAATTAWWAGGPVRAAIYQELRDRGNTTKTVVVRIAKDVHGKNPSGRFYVRAVVSQAHSAESGDDLELCRALIEPLTSSDEPIWAAFKGGRATLHRDPTKMTEAWFTTSADVSEVGAKISINITNSEVGSASLSTSLHLTFTIDQIDGNTQAVHVAIPVGRAASRTVHRGNAVGREIRKLGENVMLAMGWAPGALEALAKADVHSTDLIDAETKMTAALRKADPKVSATDARNMVNAAFTLADQYSEKGKALSLVLTLAILGHTVEASTLVASVAGSI